MSKYYRVPGKPLQIVSPEIEAEWLKKNPNATFAGEVEEKKVETSTEGKGNGDATTGANATSGNEAPNTDLESGESLSASQSVNKKSPRTGVRKNEDGTESTHLMRRELVDGKWVVFPSLFQEEDGSWKDMSKEGGWYNIHQEAKKRGEVYEFNNVEEAINFADKGSWKEGFFQEDGSSELPEPSWGDLFKSGLNTLIGPVKTAAISKVGETITDVYDDYKEGKEKEEKARRSKQEYVNQSANFNQELDKAFGEDPALFGQIIENPSDLSLQDRQVSNTGSPDKYLLELVKKQLGGFGLLGEDSKFRQNNYPDLNNDDLHELIEDKFYSKLDEFKQNKSNKLSLEKASKTENVRQWQDDNRATMISGYSDVNNDIAQQVEKLNHSELTEEEWDVENKKLLDLKATKGDGTSMMYNLSTGELTTARGNENNENVVPLNKEEKQAEWKSVIGLLKPENQLDYLRNEFERSALTLSAHNEELDKVQRWSVLKTGYELADDKAKGKPLEGRRIVESTLREMMMDTEFADFNPVPTDELRGKSGEDRDNVINKWVADIKTYKQDNLDYNREYEALKGMYLLNEGLDDLQKPEYLSIAGLPTIIPTNFSALKQSGEKLIEPWTGDYYTTSMMGSTGRENITATDAVYDNLGIEKTLSEQKQTEESLSEMVNGGLLGMNKMLVEFAGINKGMAITGLAQKVAGVHKLLTSGRWVKNGKVISDAAMKARAAAKGITVEAYASQLGRFSNVKKLKAAKDGYEGFKFIPATNGGKALDVLFGGLVEGAKFEAFTQFDITKLEMKPEAGEHFGFAEGFGFGMAGRISPFLQKKGFLKDIDKTVLGRKFGVSSRKLFETFVTQPASFVVGSNAGGIVDNLVKDALGNESFKNFIDEKYGDHDQLGKDLIVEYLTGLGLGGIHFKGFKDYEVANFYNEKKEIQTTIKNYITNKFFINNNRSLVDNGIASLWWACEFTHSPWEKYSTIKKNNKDKYNYTEIILSKPDIYQQVFERTYGRETPLIFHLLDFIIDNNLGRSEYRPLVISLNSQLAFNVFSNQSEDAIKSNFLKLMKT